jgi:tetratricopeptide (TPR) repeat protein
MLRAQLGRQGEALEALEQAAPSGEPAPTRIVQAYAHVLARAGRRDDARALVQQHLDRQPINLVLEATLETLEAGDVPPAPIASPEAGMADALLGLAEALEQQQASGQAILYARLALVLEPELAEAALLLGNIFARQDNHEAALDLLAAVPGSHPLSWEARLRAAESLHALGRVEEAVRRLEAMASERSERIDPLVTIGDLLRRDEAFERAEVAYSRAIERLDGFERQHWPLLYTRGITYERTGRWDEAEADFLLALELEPDQPYVLNYLAYSWVDQGVNLEQALPMLQRAVDLRPNDGFIIDSLGWAYYRLGDYDDAVRYLERAVELEPGDPILNDHLGDAYWRVGRLREARFQWLRALTLDPEEDEIALIEDKLEHGLPERAAANASE